MLLIGKLNHIMLHNRLERFMPPPYMLHRKRVSRCDAASRTGAINMLTIGDKLPGFTLPVQQGSDALPAGETINLGESNGRWKILFYWPKDFTFVCPTEIVGYGELQR